MLRDRPFRLYRFYRLRRSIVCIGLIGSIVCTRIVLIVSGRACFGAQVPGLAGPKTAPGSGPALGHAAIFGPGSNPRALKLGMIGWYGRRLNQSFLQSV